MVKLNKNTIKPDKMLSAVCGLYCPSCTLFIGNHEDPERLAALTRRMGRTPEEMKCNGCRSDTLSFYCRSCKMKSCAKEKGIDFCSECDEYPCEALTAFKAEAAHRCDVWESLDQIKSRGWEDWFVRMTDMTSCPECGTINSAYDASCRKCGHNPGSGFFEKYREAVMDHLKKISG